LSLARPQEAARPSSLPWAAYTANSITDLKAFRGELASVMLNGYAVNNEEIDVGIRAVAAPVRGRKGVRHAISIVGPTFRMTDEKMPEYIALVKDRAARISESVQAAGY